MLTVVNPSYDFVAALNTKDRALFVNKPARESGILKMLKESK
ncbi:MAG: hypothetical protein WA667_29030 [Candidatus Nitrosopolaris sp.]